MERYNTKTSFTCHVNIQILIKITEENTIHPCVLCSADVTKQNPSFSL